MNFLSNKLVISAFCIVMNNHACADLWRSTDLELANLLNGKSEKFNIEYFIQLGEDWPRLDPLNGYENKVDGGKILIAFQGILNELANLTRQVQFSNDDNSIYESGLKAAKLYSLLVASGGYTNEVLACAAYEYSKFAVFSLLGNKDNIEKINQIHAILNKKSTENLNIKSWLLSASEYDTQLQNEMDALNGLGDYPSAPNLVFHFINSGIPIPNSKTYNQLLENTHALNLGIRMYEIDFYKSVIVPFWVSATAQYGSPDATDARKLSELDSYKKMLDGFPPHPFIGENVTIDLALWHWLLSTDAEHLNNAVHRMN